MERMRRVCTCVDTVRDIPPCPAHGVFPTASRRQELERALDDHRCYVCAQRDDESALTATAESEGSDAPTST